MANLLIPKFENQDEPEVSIVIPSLNEEITISEFVSWCKIGLEDANTRGEILIVDSSTDNTPRLALASGARVLTVQKNGLGAAYKDALNYARGKFLILGDADCTYDFRQIRDFIDSFKQGHEFIMGSRFRGYIEPHAMPWLHRYFGIPLTTKILNIIYRSQFTDIHCGMRGITKDAFLKMKLSSNSWEYASEMVLKAIQMRLKISEVPVSFYKDKKGRLSHHKRSGWLSPWKAGWINLKVMLINGAEFFTLRPGLILLMLGLFLTIPFALGPLKIGSITFSLFWMIFGMSLTIIGQQSFYMGCLASVIHDFHGDKRKTWFNLFSYNRSTLLSGLLIVLGLICILPLCVSYFHFGLSLPMKIGRIHHMALIGILSIVSGFMHFIFTLILQSLAVKDNTI